MTITVNGIKFTYGYLANSDQIETIKSAPAGDNYDQVIIDNKPHAVSSNHNAQRIREIQVAATNPGGSVNVFDDLVNGSGNSYNQQDQITGRTISRVDNSGTSPVSTTTSLAYEYDASQGDALTKITEQIGNTPAVTTSYHYDGVGNLTSTQVGTSFRINADGGRC